MARFGMNHSFTLKLLQHPLDVQSYDNLTKQYSLFVFSVPIKLEFLEYRFIQFRSTSSTWFNSKDESYLSRNLFFFKHKPNTNEIQFEN